MSIKKIDEQMVQLGYKITELHYWTTEEKIEIIKEAAAEAAA